MNRVLNRTIVGWRGTWSVVSVMVLAAASCDAPLDPQTDVADTDTSEAPDAPQDAADDGVDIGSDDIRAPDVDTHAPAPDSVDDPTTDLLVDPSEDPGSDPGFDVLPIDPNACGGTAELLFEGVPAQPLDRCGEAGTGFLVCNGVDALLCLGEPAVNVCGGTGELRATPGDACGCDGVWTCADDGVVCAGGSGANSCGGCASLMAEPGYACRQTGGGSGGWRCAGPDAVTCDTNNLCGGGGVLEPSTALPGAPCEATCGPGVWRCDGSESLVCQPNLPCNGCGGGTSLAGNPAEACGVFGDGSWACDGTDRVVCEGATTPNVCGGTEVLTGAPGEACGAGQQYVCVGDELRCQTVADPGVGNACGGASALDGEPSTPCGACGTGLWRCADTNTVVCTIPDEIQRNACGGCGGLVGEVALACGVCGDGALACDIEGDTLLCENTTQTLNVCGGCGPMDGELGADCGPCGQYTCNAETRRLVCIPRPVGACALTCADIGETCTAESRTCVAGAEGVDATCGNCLAGYEEVGGNCLSPISAPTGVVASDGTSAAHVTVTWEEVEGATGYLVFRDGAQITPTPVFALTFDDTTAPAGGVPPEVTGVAATNNRTGDVQVTWMAATPPAGATQTYTVVALAGEQQSMASASDTGFRGAQPILRYEVELRGTWTAAGTGTSDTDGDAPAGTIAVGAPTATTDRTDGIALSLVSPSTTAGAAQTYRVRAVNAAGTSNASASANGWRTVGAPTLQWQRSTDEAGSYADVGGATSATYLDTSMTGGQARWYRVVVGAAGAVAITTPATSGRRVRTCSDVACAALSRLCTDASGSNDALCGACLPNLEEVGGACLTPLPTPTGVSASDGSSAAHVTVTWEAVEGAAGYLVSRNGTQITATPVSETSYDDTAAPPGGVPETVSGVTATQNLFDEVEVTWVEATSPMGAAQAYTVVAIAGEQQSAESDQDVGFRGALPITAYEVERRGTWAPAGTGTSFSDTEAGAGAIVASAPTASQDRSSGISLSFVSPSTSAGASQTYRVRAVNEAGTGAASLGTSGRRVVGDPTVQIQSADREEGPFSVVAGATTSPYLDASMDWGETRWYRAVVRAAGVGDVTTLAVEGRRLSLGAPCSADEGCGTGEWCPTDTTHRRCAPRPVVGEVPILFQYIPAGTYVMGSPTDEIGRDYWEREVDVTLTRPFFLQRFEVTQAQWTALSGGVNPSCFQTTSGTTCTRSNSNPNGPVERVDWNSLAAYANALSLAEGLPPCYVMPASGCSWEMGRLACEGGAIDVASGNPYDCTGYRLPTEAEWEYAVRAGTVTATYAGNLSGVVNTCTSPPSQTNLGPIAWWCRNAADRTQQVGGKLPNQWGLYDMLGNVREWTADSQETLEVPGGTDPWVRPTQSGRILRGGGWLSTAEATRAAARRRESRVYRFESLGARLARTAP